MIRETTGKYTEVCIPYRQKAYEPYEDCYGVYKYARRVKDDYVELSQTPDFVSDYNEEYPRTIIRHRWVYLNEVGKLTSDIIIHHINHVKGDDRPENLQPTSRGQHKRLHNQQAYIHSNGINKAKAK